MVQFRIKGNGEDPTLEASLEISGDGDIVLRLKGLGYDQPVLSIGRQGLYRYQVLPSYLANVCIDKDAYGVTRIHDYTPKPPLIEPPTVIENVTASTPDSTNPYPSIEPAIHAIADAGDAR